MTNSPGSRRRPWNRRPYRSSTTAALAAKAGSRGKIQERCRQGLSASWSSQRHSVETETSLTRPVVMTSSRSSARLQRPSGTPRVVGNSQAIALTSTTTAEGETARPARPLAVGQPFHALLDVAFAPLGGGVGRDLELAGDPGVGPPRGGQQHDPGPGDLPLLGGRLAHQGLQPPALRRPEHDLKRATPTAATSHPARSSHRPSWSPHQPGGRLRDTTGRDRRRLLCATHDPGVDQDLAWAAAPSPPTPALAGPGHGPGTLPWPLRLRRRGAA